MSHFLRGVNNLLFSLFNANKPTPSQEEIDVVIPIIEKDLRVLPLCLEGIKNGINHPVKNIYIVAPQQEEIILFCDKHGLIYVDETSVLGFGPKQLNLMITISDGIVQNRSGWLFQQLIKLSGTIGTCNNYLCIDADHVLLQPHTFVCDDGKPIFYMTSECHQPYYNAIQKLIGDIPQSSLSYVAHKMIFNRKQVMALHNRILQHTKEDWIAAILTNYDRTQISGFSEFETYGNFVSNKILLPWRQHTLRYKKMTDYKKLVKKYGKIFRSITFPDYYNN